MKAEERLLRDKDVARILGMSPEWVRGQRYKRRHSMPHVFLIDPVMIGGNPRYPEEEVLALVKRFKDVRKAA